METRDGRTKDYLELNEGSTGLLFGDKFNRFYKRIETQWIRGKATDGRDGIVPVDFSGEHLVFDVRKSPGSVLHDVRFTTRLMDSAAALAHVDCFRRLYKKEAEQWPLRSLDRAHDSAVTHLMELDVYALDKTDYSNKELSSYLQKAKKKARDIGLEM